MNTRMRVGIASLGIVVLTIMSILIVRTISNKQASSHEPIIASYLCKGGKTINATFYPGTLKSAATPDKPPVPSGSVVLNLNNNETLMTLAQTLSADGSRYANSDESFIFWSKGNGALVLENNKEKNYVDCIVVASAAKNSNLTQVYVNSANGVSIRLPQEYSVEPYQYQELGPGKEINGVKFTISTSTAAGTNLAEDSYVSIESLAGARECRADLFLDQSIAHTVVGNNITYSVASSTGAGAGNRYEETVYALSDTNPCIAVRYYIHYGVFENWPAGAVKQFDKPALLAQFDAIRRTLVASQ